MTTTLDTNHLRRLLAKATPRPWRLNGHFWIGNEVLFDKVQDMRASAYLVNDAEVLLDRSDALDEALQLLRKLYGPAPELNPDLSYITDDDTFHEVEEFLSRFPQETK